MWRSTPDFARVSREVFGVRVKERDERLRRARARRRIYSSLLWRREPLPHEPIPGFSTASSPYVYALRAYTCPSHEPTYTTPPAATGEASMTSPIL